MTPSSLVILANITICLVEEILVFNFVFHVNHFPQSLLNLSFSGFGALPTRETNHSDDFIDVGHDSLDYHWRLSIFNLGKQLGQCCLCLVPFILRINLFFSLNDVLSKGEQPFQKVETVGRADLATFLSTKSTDLGA